MVKLKISTNRIPKNKKNVIQSESRLRITGKLDLSGVDTHVRQRETRDTTGDAWVLTLRS